MNFEEEFKKHIRKFAVDDVINFCSERSIKMYNNKKPFEMFDVPYYNRKTGKKEVCKNFTITQYELIRLCFYSILYGNDYRSTKLDENNFLQLISSARRIADEADKNDPNLGNYILEYMQVLTNEQFDFQIINSFINKFNRIHYILTEINQNEKYNQTNKVSYINFSETVKKLTGHTIATYNYMNLFLTLLIAGNKKPNISDVFSKQSVNFSNLPFSKKELEKFVDSNSKDYKFYRDNNEWLLLKYNPIITTQKTKEKLICNVYAFIISFSDKIYWLIRNYYADLKKRDFTSYFGYCFECYLKEIFEFYKINLNRVPESKKEQPDWTFETNKYFFIIEQKSTLFSLSARDTMKQNKKESIHKYIRNNIEKAHNQLNNYVYNPQNKEIIKICLMFEKVYMEENVKEIMTKNMNIKLSDNFWITDIDTMEIFISILATDEKKFNKIVDDKINKDKENYKGGRRLSLLLEGERNNYIRNKANYFKWLSDDIIKRLK